VRGVCIVRIGRETAAVVVAAGRRVHGMWLLCILPVTIDNVTAP